MLCMRSLREGMELWLAEKYFLLILLSFLVLIFLTLSILQGDIGPKLWLYAYIRLPQSHSTNSFILILIVPFHVKTGFVLFLIKFKATFSQTIKEKYLHLFLYKFSYKYTKQSKT